MVCERLRKCVKVSWVVVGAKDERVRSGWWCDGGLEDAGAMVGVGGSLVE